MALTSPAMRSAQREGVGREMLEAQSALQGSWRTLKAVVEQLETGTGDSTTRPQGETVPLMLSVAFHPFREEMKVQSAIAHTRAPGSEGRWFEAWDFPEFCARQATHASDAVIVAVRWGLTTTADTALAREFGAAAQAYADAWRAMQRAALEAQGKRFRR